MVKKIGKWLWKTVIEITYGLEEIYYNTKNIWRG